MRPEPALTPDAHADVLQAVDYYNAQRFGLGFEFLDEMDRTTSQIREAPLLSTLVDPPTRRSLLHRFPYGVFFVAGSETEADVVVAVLDLRQEPEVIRQAYSR